MKRPFITAEEVRIERLGMLRQEMGSQKALAARVGCSPAQIGQYEGGHRTMGPEFARKVEEACAKPRGWLDQPTGQADAHLRWPFATISTDEWLGWPEDLRLAAESHLAAFIRLELARRQPG